MHNKARVERPARGARIVSTCILSFTLLFVSAFAEARTCAELLANTSEAQKLRLLTYNLKNLSFEAAQKGKKQVQKQKRLDDIAKVIKEIDADIMTLEEVSTLESLLELNSEYLNQNYNVFFFEGNTRGNGIGFLVRKTLPYSIVTNSFSDTLWVDPVDGQRKTLFTRDAPALQFLDKNNKVVFNLIGVHLKSMRDRQGDEKSKVLRGAEVQALIEIIESLSEETGAPVIVNGDFNYDLRSDENADLLDHVKDSFDLAKTPTPLNNRTTFVHFYSQNNKDLSINNQLDGILVSPHSQLNILDVQIYYYNSSKSLPKDHDERESNPSDHFPIYTDISIAS